MDSDLPDVHVQDPSFKVGLTRVGVKGVRKTVVQESEEGSRTILPACFDAFVDLKPAQRGVHMSRHNEVLNEIIERTLELKIADAEMLCSAIAKELLERHDGAERAEVVMRSDYTKPKSTPKSSIPVQEHYSLNANSVVWREGSELKMRKRIGVSARGITVCPCGQELSKEWARKKLEKNGFNEEQVEFVLSTVPVGSHNQRSEGFLSIETWEDCRVEADDLIEVIESSMSFPVFEILKREDEKHLILEAHSNPVFVEDCVRSMLKRVLEKYSGLPDDAVVVARQTNFESVHNHDAFAERCVSLGELREEALGIEGG